MKKFYEIRGAVSGCEPGHLTEEQLDCYSECVDLGWYESDQEALDAANARQEEDDSAAENVPGGAPLDGWGPCYAACLYRLEAPFENFSKVEA